MSKSIYFATSNLNKYREAENIIGKNRLKLLKKKLIEIKDYSLENIAIYSLKVLTESFNEAVFVEDSGLFISALSDFPGFATGYVHKTLGNKNILVLLEDEKDRSAYFKSVIAFKPPSKGPKLKLFVGTTNGVIVDKEKGTNGFDYDPIFQPSGSEKTFGEMTIEEKNKFSHRGKALQRFNSWLEEEYW